MSEIIVTGLLIGLAMIILLTPLTVMVAKREAYRYNSWGKKEQKNWLVDMFYMWKFHVFLAWVLGATTLLFIIYKVFNKDFDLFTTVLICVLSGISAVINIMTAAWSKGCLKSKQDYAYEIKAYGNDYFTNDISYGNNALSFVDEDGAEIILTNSDQVKVTKLR